MVTTHTYFHLFSKSLICKCTTAYQNAVVLITELPFCHDNEIKDEFGLTDTTTVLFLNASYDAIASGFPNEEARGNEYCTCKVYATEPIETLRIQPKYYASDSVTSECKKRVDVINHNDQLTAFNCIESGMLQISHIEAGQYIQFHLRATNGFTLVSEDLDQFVIYIGPGRNDPSRNLKKKQ